MHISLLYSMTDMMHNGADEGQSLYCKPKHSVMLTASHSVLHASAVLAIRKACVVFQYGPTCEVCRRAHACTMGVDHISSGPVQPLVSLPDIAAPTRGLSSASLLPCVSDLDGHLYEGLYPAETCTTTCDASHPLHTTRPTTSSSNAPNATHQHERLAQHVDKACTAPIAGGCKGTGRDGRARGFGAQSHRHRKQLRSDLTYRDRLRQGPLLWRAGCDFGGGGTASIEATTS
jgi:hypothetical protein